MQVRISTRQGEGLVIAPKCGGAQGDRVMPVHFRRTYEGDLEEWVEKRQDDLEATIQGHDQVDDLEIDLSITSYADDVKEINVVPNAKEAVEAIGISGNLLDSIISGAKLKQNTSKAEHVATFLGVGKADETRRVKAKLEEHGLGDLKRCARYLGAWLQDDLGTTTTVRKRCLAAKEAYYSMGRAWRSKINLRLKKSQFKGLVVTTLLSGLEAETLRACDLEKLEKCLLGLARRMLGVRGFMTMWTRRGSIPTERSEGS